MCLLGKKECSTVWIDTQGDPERVSLSWLFESALWGIASGFPLAKHFYLSGSESIFGVSQDPPRCMRTLLSQDEFHWRGLWVGRLTIIYLLISKELSKQEGFLDFENEIHVIFSLWAGLSLLSWLSCYSHLGIWDHREWISNCSTLGGGWGGLASCPPPVQESMDRL